MGVGLGRTEHEGWCRDLADDKRRVGCLGWTEVVKRGGVGGDVLDGNRPVTPPGSPGDTTEPSEQILGVSGMVRVAALGGTPELEGVLDQEREERRCRHQPSGAKLRSWRSAVGHSHGRTARTRIATTIVLIGFIGPHVVTLTASPTAAAPISGPSAPSSAGAMIVPFECCRSATLSISTGSSEERVTEPQGDRTGDDGELQIEQIGNRTDGSADEPASPDAFGFVGRFGGTARAGGDAGAADLGLQHVLHMGVEIGALGFDHDMTDVAGIPCVAVEQSAVEDDATSDAGRHDHADEVRHAAGLPFHASPSASAFAPLSMCTARPVCSASRVRSGKSRHTGILIGDTASPACRMGPPAHAADTHGRHRGCCDLVEKFRQSNEQCLGLGDIRRWGTPSINDRPIHTDDAASIFVPPISTARRTPRTAS